jgi:hypothetical protein
MNFGDSVQDASRSGPDDGLIPGAVGGDGDSHQARSLRTQKSIQDIQDLIDKLAAVTQQLRHPGRRSDGVRSDSVRSDSVRSDSTPEPVGLGHEAPQ